MQDLMQDLASLLRKILIILAYFLQDHFTCMALQTDYAVIDGPFGPFMPGPFMLCSASHELS